MSCLPSPHPFALPFCIPNGPCCYTAPSPCPQVSIPFWPRLHLYAWPRPSAAMAWYERRAPSGSNFNSDDGSGPIGQGFSSRQAFQLRRQARVSPELWGRNLTDTRVLGEFRLLHDYQQPPRGLGAGRNRQPGLPFLL